jgi:hypothetical protein
MVMLREIPSLPIEKFKEKDPVIKHIQQFQKLSLRVDGIPKDKLLDIFIGTLKDNIQHEVYLFQPAYLEKDFMVARKVEIKNLEKDTRRTNSNTSRENNAPSSYPPQQMDERREKGLCFNCDSKYSKGHKCCEKKLCSIDYEEEEANEQEPSQAEEIENITPTISSNALDGISTPQTQDQRLYKNKKGNIVD